MSQVEAYSIPGSPLSMAVLASRLVDLFAASNSFNRGPTAPTNPFEGMAWLDTSSAPVETFKRYTVVAGWIGIFSINISTGALSFLVPDAMIVANMLAANAVTADKIAAGAVETTKLKDSSVTLDKLAKVGTSGQVLTSNGTEAPPSYQDVSGVPVGAVFPYAGSTAPTNFLLCAGQAVSRTTYAGLFSAIGTTYGAGDGSTTFNLPDMRGRTAAGKDDMGGAAASRLTGSASGGVNGATLGASGGEQSHAMTSAENGPHAHNVSGAAYGASGSGSGAFGGGSYGFQNIVIQSSGNGTAHNNVQPTLVLNYIIKAK